MPVYWSIFFLSLLVLLVATRTTKRYQLSDNSEIYRTDKHLYYFTVLYLLFWVACRDYVQDTYAYVGMFKMLPANWDWNEVLNGVMYTDSGKVFYLVQAFFKCFISESHYWWFAFVGGISLFSLFRVYRKYTPDFPLTFYLFIASTNFTWLINGMRQFVVACLLVGFCDWLIEGDKRHKFFYYLLILFLGYVHSSALFLLPVCYFTSRGKLLDKWMLMIVLATVVATNFSGSIMGAAMEVMNKDYSDALDTGTGSSVIRLVVAAVPLVLVLFKFRQVKVAAGPATVFFINMSLVGVCFFFAATFTNGILIGRMPIYFTIYNYILLPWLLLKFYKRGPFRIGCIVFYAIFFYYQMHIAWKDLAYGSDLLGIHYFNRLGF